MAFFVYYTDDYQDCGGEGFEEFKTKEDAAAFIEHRMSTHGTNADPDCYRVIEGDEVSLRVVHSAIKVEIGG